MERDDDVRAACFAALDVLCAQHSDELPYKGGLDRGFAFRGGRVPFLNYQKGIYRAAVQRGPAALSINTSFNSPYDDAWLESELVYAYRAGSLDQPDNRALRSAHTPDLPLVYFFATQPGYYQPHYPCYVVDDDPIGRHVRVSKGDMVGPPDEQTPILSDDPIERRYANRQVRVRMHQGRFRGLVLRAYTSQCAICRLKEIRLLDAAHIIGDPEPSGEPRIPNGLCFCSIHHRAFDSELVGVSPDYSVHVSRRLLNDEDGPMLDVLKGFQGKTIHLPRRNAWHPDRERLATRFERFREAE